MEEKKLYVVHTDVMTCMNTCEHDITLVKATSSRLAISKAKDILNKSSLIKCVGYSFAVESYIHEAD